MNIRIQILCLLLLFSICCRPVDEDFRVNMGNSKTPIASKWAEVIKSLDSTDTQLRERSAEELVAIGKQSAIIQAEISRNLVEQGKNICAENVDKLSSRMSFDKLRTIADILAKFESIEGLEMLIDCSDYVEEAGGLSPFHSATIPAILSYKEKAKPTLMSKWSTSSSVIKCNIANALAESGGDEVRGFLKSRVEHESDKEVLQCLAVNIDYLNRQ